MWPSLTAIVLISFITGLAGDCYAQRLHNEDLKYFCLVLRSHDSLGHTIIDCSQPQGWFLHEVGENLPRFLGLGEGRDSLTVFGLRRPVPEQDGRASRWGYPEGCRFHILTSEGWEIQDNAMTVWRYLSEDSLAYECAQVGLFVTSVGQAAVRAADIFPDSSYFVVVEKSGEGGVSWEFFRGEDPCNLSMFYSATSSFPDDQTNQFITNSFIFNSLERSYQVVQTTTFGDWPTIDSASCQILNVWDMAVEHFAIDTTGIE